MLDILLFYTKHPSWNHEKFLADFLKSECYWKPLKLESAANNNFLETNFSANQWELSFRLKNPNEETRKVWTVPFVRPIRMGRICGSLMHLIHIWTMI